MKKSTEISIDNKLHQNDLSLMKVPFKALFCEEKQFNDGEKLNWYMEKNPYRY